MTSCPKRRWELLLVPQFAIWNISCSQIHVFKNVTQELNGRMATVYTHDLLFLGSKGRRRQKKSQQGTHFHLTQEATSHWWEYNSSKKQETCSSGKVPGHSAPQWRTPIPSHSRPFATSLGKAKSRTMRKCHKMRDFSCEGGKEKDKWGSVSGESKAMVGG